MAPGYTIIDNDAVLDRLPEIDGTALKVYLALARRADSVGRCWPSQKTLGCDTGLKPRSIRSALHRLKTMKLVELESHPGRASTYLLTRAPPCRPNNGGPAPSCRPPRRRHAGDPGAAVPETPAPPCLQNNTQRTNYKNNTQLTRARGCAASVSFPEELDSELFQKAWTRWTEHRKELRKPLTPSTIKAQLHKLAAWGEKRAIAAIDRSIEAGWTGLFEEKNNGKNRRNGFPLGPGQKFAGTGNGRVGVF